MVVSTVFLFWALQGKVLVLVMPSGNSSYPKPVESLIKKFRFWSVLPIPLLMGHWK